MMNFKTILFFLFLINLSKCSIKEHCDCKIVSNSKIIGGKNSHHLAFPWIASLSFDNFDSKERFRLKLPEKYKIRSHYCGGIILNSKWILTAGHCIYPDEPRSVGFGNDNDLIKIFDAGRIRVKKSFLHPKFNETNLTNDIGLLELNETINFMKTVKPGCLHTNYRSVFNNSLVAIGFGLTEQLKLNNSTKNFYEGTNSRHLKEILIRDVSSVSKKCSNEPAKLCANYITKGDSSCRADSGSPIMIQRNGKSFIVGLTSSSDDYEALKTDPNILNYCTGFSFYQRIASHLDFIEDHIGQDYCSNVEFFVN